MRKRQTHWHSGKKNDPEGTLCGRVATKSRILNDGPQVEVTCKTCAWMLRWTSKYEYNQKQETT